MKSIKHSLLLIALSVVSLAQAQMAWPPVTQTTKPWTRWWWEGSAVNKTDLTWNLEQYQKAGLGGTEITPIYGIHGYENEFINFLTPKWMEMLQHTLNESKRLGIGVDMANATGWPFGGPWVHNEDASKSVYFKTYTLKENEQLKEKVEYVREGLIRPASTRRLTLDEIKQPVWENSDLQSLAIDQVQFPGKLPMQCLVAYSKEGQTIDLTSKVDTAGNLSWTAPAGDWTLYALFEGLHGKMVERAAPGGEGYAIDHFSAKAAKEYFKKFDESFKGYDLSYLRGFFNDSYEVDDARGQSNWTGDMFEQFKKRKGYDLKMHLPALFGKADEESNKRVLYDYRSVIDELILENFTEQWKLWANGKKKILRNQSHGSPANTLDLYSVVDIPETEGNDVLRFKFATSAANVMGKPLVSSESATWLNEHFLSSWADVKKAIDLYFVGGVNHIFYHGTSYSPQNVPWPGWLFYAAVHFQPVNPQWKDFHVLNEYITRVQSFLQTGKPDNDVLLYYPIVDRYTQRTPELLQHFDGMEKNFEHTDFEHVSKWMLENGYSFDFFSDRQLQQFTVKNKSVVSHGNAYKVILLPANKFIPENSMQQLMKLAKQGATILFYKELPKEVPGYLDHEQKSKVLQQSLAALSFSNQNELSVAKLTNGGSFVVGNELSALLRNSRVRQEPMTLKHLQFVRRTIADTTIYFISNHTDNEINEWVPLSGKYGTVLLFDAMTGKSGAANVNTDTISNVLLHLQPGASIVLKAFSKKVQLPAFPYYNKAAQPSPIQGKWTIKFNDGGPVIPSSVEVDHLGSWTDLTGDDVKSFSGTATYSIHFARPAGSHKYFSLVLGTIHETAEIKLNGKSIATLIGPTFQTIIAADQLKENNLLEITVANLMANRISYMDKNNMPWKIFYNTNMPARKRENVKDGLFNAADWKPLPSGLLGPVTITPLIHE